MYPAANFGCFPLICQQQSLMENNNNNFGCFSLVPVFNAHGYPQQQLGIQGIPLVAPFGYQGFQSTTNYPNLNSLLPPQNQKMEFFNKENSQIIDADDSPFFSKTKTKRQISNETKHLEFPVPPNLEGLNQYKPYGSSYEPNLPYPTHPHHQENHAFSNFRYPSYGWASHHPKPEIPKPNATNAKPTNDEDENKIPIEEVEEFENEGIAEMENLKIDKANEEDQKAFEAKFNVQGFTIKDIKVQWSQNQLLIEGKQKSKNQLGAFIRSFIYVINVPENIETSSLTATLESDGMLFIKGVPSKTDSLGEE